jgi:hypothetical protein
MDHDPADDPVVITHGGRSRSRREVDPGQAAAQALVVAVLKLLSVEPNRRIKELDALSATGRGPNAEIGIPARREHDL